jgi:hypothetical protein
MGINIPNRAHTLIVPGVGPCRLDDGATWGQDYLLALDLANEKIITKAPGTGTGDLLSSNNLSDVADIPTAVSNLGLTIGTNTQAFSANLSTLSAIVSTAFGRAFLTIADEAAARAYIGASDFDGAFSSLTGTPTTLAGYGITDGQPLNNELSAFAALADTGGLVRKTGDGAYSLDTATYLTSVGFGALTGSARDNSDLNSELDALQTNIDGKADVSHTHAQSEVTNLVSDLALKADLVGGVVPTSQIPAIAITEFLGTVANQTAMLALTGQKGDWCNRSDTGTNFVITGTDPTQIGDWTELSYPSAPVVSVNSQTGTVVLDYTDVGAAAASHTHTLANITDAGSAAAFDETDFAAALHGHPQSDITGLVSDLAAKAPLVSPALTGIPTSPTATPGTNTTQIATTAFVQAAVTGGGGGDVSKVGTPVDNQIAVWTGDGTIEGTSSFVYDGSYVDIIDGSNYCVRLGQRIITVGGTTTLPNYGAKVSYDFAGKGARFWGEHNGQGSATLAGSNPVQAGWGGVQVGGSSHSSIAGMVRFFTDGTLRGVIEHDGIWNPQQDVEVRDGSNGRRLSAYKTHASATSFERVVIDTTASATEMRFCSENGSAGGTYRDLVIGARPGGSWFPSFAINSTGDLTFTGEIVSAASASGKAGFNVPHGTAPSAPVNGDFWSTTAGFYGRVNGSTIGPFQPTSESLVVAALDGATLTDIGTPAATDLVLVLDASDSNNLKVVQASALGGGGGGTVTSVAISGTDGLQVDSGSPITSAGTIQLGVDAAALRTHINVANGADQTTFANVQAAGALMDSELADVTAIKTLLAPDNTTISTFGASLTDDADAAAARTTIGVDIGQITVTFDGGDSAIENNTTYYMKIERACTILGWYATANESGLIDVDIWRASWPIVPVDANSIVGGNEVQVSLSQVASDDILTGWTVALNAGDHLAFNAENVTGVKRLTLVLKVRWD